MTAKEIRALVSQFLAAGPHADGDILRRLVVSALVEGLTGQLKIEHRRIPKGGTIRVRRSGPQC